ncbi:MAG: rhomboid family intramembrane serine protease [Actinobacteria bacterium]|nr:rhomboid family intramembrane serine protease [Actinomycetota bacterium]
MGDRQAGLLTGDNLRGGRFSGGWFSGGWHDLSAGKAIRAAIFVTGFLGLLWLIQLINWADSYGLNQRFGILPHHESHLGDIFTAPLLHFNWQHIEGNSLPFLILGFLAAYRGIMRFVTVTLIVAVTSGLAVWLFQSSTELTVGASGLIFGYFGYVLVRGLFDRNLIDIVVGVLAGIAYASILAVAIPGTPGISWIGHAGGLAGGVLAGWVLRSRRPAAVRAGAGRPVAAAPPRPAVSNDNPRAALHKELDDMGL